MQDSIAESTMRARLTQPAPEEKFARPRPKTVPVIRSQKGNVSEKGTIPTTIHMEPIDRRRLCDRLAGQKDPKLTSISGMANAMIKRGLSMDPDKPYGPSLEPVIEGSINKNFLRHDNRLASLQAHDTYNSTKSLHLATNSLSLILTLFELLGHKLEGDPFKRIVEESENKAIEALTKRNPVFLEMVKDTHLNPQALPEEEGRGK